MKTSTARILTLLALMSAGMAMTASAQKAESIRINVPFEFSFAGQTFPAGEYSVTQPSQHMVALRDAEKRTIAQALSAGIQPNTPVVGPKVRFTSENGQYILSEVWMQDFAGEAMAKAKTLPDLAKHRSKDTRVTAEGNSHDHAPTGQN